MLEENQCTVEVGRQNAQGKDIFRKVKDLHWDGCRGERKERKWKRTRRGEGHSWITSNLPKVLTDTRCCSPIANYVMMCISHIRKTSQMWRAIFCHSSHVFYFLLPELLVRTCWRETHYEHICTETGRVYRWRITALVFFSVSLPLLEKMCTHWKSKLIWAIEESVLACEHIVSFYPPSLRFNFQVQQQLYILLLRS